MTPAERRKTVAVGATAGLTVGFVVGLALPPTRLSLVICVVGAAVGLLAGIVVLGLRGRRVEPVLRDRGGHVTVRKGAA